MLHERTRVTVVVGILVLTTALMFPTSGTATAVDVADQVITWNQHAYDELIVTGAQAPPVAAMHLAMVHGAIYDAVNAIDGGYEPYLGSPPTTGAESRDAAAAAAAYQVLLSLLPDDRDDELLRYYSSSPSRSPSPRASRSPTVPSRRPPQQGSCAGGPELGATITQLPDGRWQVSCAGGGYIVVEDDFFGNTGATG